VHGVLSCGTGKCIVEQIQNEEKVDTGEWFFTSGEDRIFPKGFPVGTVVSSAPGQGMKDVKLNLSGAPGGVEEVLVVLQGVHQPIPAAPVVDESTAKMLPPPPPDPGANGTPAVKPQTEADKIVQKYDSLGKEQGHIYGGVGSNMPNFNLKPAGQPAQSPTAQPATAQNSPAKPVVAVSNNQPSLLGARPAPKPPAAKPAGQAANLDTTAGTPLPLGAPRRKSAPSNAPSEQPPPR
jgi:rod shape-determining protein MreC